MRMAPWGSMFTELAHIPDDRICCLQCLAPNWPQLLQEGMRSPGYSNTLSRAPHEDLGQVFIMWCADWKSRVREVW